MGMSVGSEIVERGGVVDVRVGSCELSDRCGVRKRGELVEEPSDAGVRRECGRADAFDLALGLELEVGELHLGLVDGVVRGRALRCEVVDLGVQLVELGEDAS